MLGGQGVHKQQLSQLAVRGSPQTHLKHQRWPEIKSTSLLLAKAESSKDACAKGRSTPRLALASPLKFKLKPRPGRKQSER